MKKSKIVKIVIAVVLVVAILVGTIIFIVKKNDTRYEAIIMQATTGSITQTLSTTGTVESLNRGEFLIFSGVVPKEVKVKIGDKVTEGQLLATFDSASLSGVLSQQQSNYDTAKLTYENSLASAQEAKAKLPQLEQTIALLEKQVAQLEKAAEAAGNAAEPEKAAPAWVDNIDYSVLSKLLAGSYTEEQLRDFFAGLAARGSSQSSISKLIDSMTTLNNFDMSSMLGISSEETDLMTAKVNLLGQKAQKTLLETQSKNVLGSTYKSIADTAQSALKASQAAVDKLKDGWYAEADGVVSELSMTAGRPFTPVSASSSLDISSLLGGLTSGESIDINGILSSIASSSSGQSVGMAVEYYDSFVASFSLGKYDILDVKVGQKCRIDSIGHEFDGEVIFISPVASSGSALDMSNLIGSMTGGSSSGGSNSIPAQVVINNPDESVIIGIDVDIDIDIETVENAVVLPIESVLSDATGDYVFKYDSDTKTVEKVEVQLGLASDTAYEIVSGIKTGDTVVQNQSSTLESGDKVIASTAEITTAKAK